MPDNKQQLKEEIVRLTQEREWLRMVVDADKLRFKETKELADNKEKEIIELGARKLDIIGVTRSLQETKNKVEEEIVDARTRLKELTESIPPVQERLQKVESALTTVESTKEKTAERVKEMKMEIVGLKKEKEDIEKQNIQLNQARGEKEISLDELERKVALALEKSDILKKQVEEIEESKRLAEEENTNTCNEFKDRILILREELTTMENRYSSLESNITHLELQKSAAENELKKIEHKQEEVLYEFHKNKIKRENELGEVEAQIKSLYAQKAKLELEYAAPTGEDNSTDSR